MLVNVIIFCISPLAIKLEYMRLKDVKYFFVIVLLFSVNAFAQEQKSEQVETATDAAADKVDEETIETPEEVKKDEIGDLIEKVDEKEAADEAKAEEELKEEDAAEEVHGPQPEVQAPEQTAGVNNRDKVSVAEVVNREGQINVEGMTLTKHSLAEIYSPRDYKTIWFDGKTPNANYEKAIDFISKADENGLSRQYFDIEIIRKRVAEENQSENYIAKTDALITHMIVDMIKEIGNGHKIPKELNLQTYMERPVRVTNVAKAFEEFMSSSNPEEVINKYSPKHEQYHFLREALKDLIADAGERRKSEVVVEYNIDILPNGRDHTISQLRKRLGQSRIIDPKKTEDVYDKVLQQKVIEYKKKFGMEETALINKDFIDTLNGYDDERISRVKVNMERYRWLPDDMPADRIEINLPQFELYAYREGKQDFSMGAIVGREKFKTPIMNTRMYQFVLNPYWNVPKAYFLRNMLPLLRQEPNYVKNQNFELLRLEKEGWKKIDQSSVNWDSVTEDNYNFLLRQLPGNLNVLGPIKFAIVNPYDIFIHSTSEPWLFTNKFRGYSSGCMRVQDPVKLAKYVIEVGGADLTEEEFMDLFNTYQSKDGYALEQQKGKSDRYFKLKNPIPTFTTYFTASATEGGDVTFLDDVYNLDFNQAKHLGF